MQRPAPISSTCYSARQRSGKRRGWRASIASIFITCAISTVCASLSFGASVTLTWTAPTENSDGTPLTDLAGYRIYSGCSTSGRYDARIAIDDPATTRYTVDGLSGTCYFVATAINDAGIESVFSAEASSGGQPPGAPTITIEWQESTPAMAIAFDSGSGSFTHSAVSSLTFSHTVAGADRVLMVGVASRDSSAADTAVSSVTYNGVAMTAVVSQLENTGSLSTLPVRVSTFRLVAPATGAHDVVITFAGEVSSMAAGIAASFTGVDQAAPIDASGAASDGMSDETSTTQDIATIADNAWVVDFLFHSANAGTSVAGTGQTEISEQGTSDTFVSSHEGPQTPAGTVTMSWSWTGTGADVHALVALKPAEAGGGAVSPGETTQDQVLEAPSLTQTHVLSPDDIAQAQAFEAPTLSQDHQVTPADIEQEQVTEPPTLEQVHTLAVNDMAQVQSLDAVSLIVEGVLSPDDIVQIQALGAIVITQDHQLTVADLDQLQAVEAPSADVTHSITVSDISQAQALDPVTLIITGELVPLSIAQVQALQAGDLVQTHALTVENLVQLQVLGAPTTAEPGYLVVTSIRLLPALTADIKLIPALTADIKLIPALTADIKLKPQ